MTLKELAAKHGPLGDRLEYLRLPQKQEIADAAFTEGFAEALIALETLVLPLERCMKQCGYQTCQGCTEWFPYLELDDEFRCEDCSLLDGEYFVRPPPVEAEVQKPAEPAPDKELLQNSGN